MSVVKTNQIYSQRIISIDIIRGLAIILMAIDHIRDFISPTLFNPLDIEHTTLSLFFTRIVTDFCAPTFIFLAGVSIFIQKKKGKKNLSLFLITRGLWLVFLEIIYVSFCWQFSYSTILLQIIWVIGISMIIMGFVIRLKRQYTLIIGLILAFLYHLLSPLDNFLNSQTHLLWSLLDQQAVLLNLPDFKINLDYPILPWLGVMMIGYGLGYWFTDFIASYRIRLLLYCGTFLLCLYFIIKFIEVLYIYDVSMSTAQTVMQFFYVDKYPPSVLYIIFNFSLMMLLLALVELINIKKTNPLLVFGSVPMFFYLIHLPLIHLIGEALSYLTYHQSLNWATKGVVDPNKVPMGYTPSVIKVYLVWFFVIAVTYPLCLWYRNIKKKYNYWILNYL